MHYDFKLTFSEVDGWLGTTVTNTRRSPLDLMLAAMYDRHRYSHGTSTLTHDMHDSQLQLDTHICTVQSAIVAGHVLAHAQSVDGAFRRCKARTRKLTVPNLNLINTRA